MRLRQASDPGSASAVGSKGGSEAAADFSSISPPHFHPCMGKWRYLCVTFLSLPSFPRPAAQELPASKRRGAISLQSKANQLPQSTTQVLINVHAFAFKRSPIYRSILFHLGIIDPLRPSGEADFCCSPHPNLDLRLHKVNIESVLVVKIPPHPLPDPACARFM